MKQQQHNAHDAAWQQGWQQPQQQHHRQPPTAPQHHQGYAHQGGWQQPPPAAAAPQQIIINTTSNSSSSASASASASAMAGPMMMAPVLAQPPSWLPVVRAVLGVIASVFVLSACGNSDFWGYGGNSLGLFRACVSDGECGTTRDLADNLNTANQKANDAKTSLNLAIALGATTVVLACIVAVKDSIFLLRRVCCPQQTVGVWYWQPRARCDASLFVVTSVVGFIAVVVLGVAADDFAELIANDDSATASVLASGSVWTIGCVLYLIAASAGCCASCCSGCCGTTQQLQVSPGYVAVQ